MIQIRYTLPFFILLLMASQVSAINDDSWADDMTDWGYRVPISITDAPTAAGVQRMINLTYQESMQADFDDIRFYTAAGDSIDYWVEDYTASTFALVWVELPAADMAYIYAYYDNPDAEDGSDGDAVFGLWGDFRTASSLDTSKFTEVTTGGGSIDVSGGDLTCTVTSSSNTRAGITTVASFGTDTIWEFYGQLPLLAQYSEFGYGGVYLLSGNDRAIMGDLQSSTSTWRLTTKKDGTLNYLADYTEGDNDNHLFTIERQGSSAVVFKVDGATIGTQLNTAYIPTVSLALSLGLYTNNNGAGSMNVQYVREWTYDAADTSFAIGTPEEPVTDGVISYPGYDTPTDPDADGLYEDVNGNSRLDFQDIMIFFQYNAWAQANQPNVSCFDWSGNGAIEFSDVQEFWESEFT